ncbi:MAG: DUF935 family protein [Bacteroidales bacterium]|nr:DUF935 family protein [Bacteroidales bacterium]
MAKKENIILNSEKHGTFNLAKEKDRKRLKKVVVDLQRYTDMLTEHDISHWRYACQLAVNIENPSRLQLYDIYNDVDLDAHLTGAIGQVNGFVKCRSFKLTNEKGDTVKDAEVYFNTEWFKDLMDYILESIYWGHSLIELGNVITDEKGNINFDGVTLIPRKHVIPEYGRIVKSQGEGWQYGIDYRSAPYSDWLIEAGKKDDLGLYRKAALHTIPKKYAGAFWDTFAEMFGIPVRIAKTSARDDNERKKLAGMMENMGAKAWGVFDDSTEIELVESSKGDAFNVYDKRIDRCNSELSKLVLKQTMTIEDGSSLSQSQTHMKVFKNLIEAYCDMVRDIINNQLLPKMIKHGFPVQGLTFDWDDPVDYTPEQQVAIEQMVLNNYEVDGSYFEDKYGIPAGARRSNGLPSLSGSKNSPTSFFD